MSSTSTFGAFTTARLGMYASMKGLDITGHNIANINTRGYTRQVLDQSSLRVNSSDRYTSFNDVRIGSGVLCTGVSQLRDPYLDIRYRNEAASVGANDAKLSALQEISSILDEVAKNDGDGVIEKQFNDMLKQLQTLNQNVGQQENDTLVRSSASVLTSLLNSYSTKLDDVGKNLDTRFKQDLADVNNILKNISELNGSIRHSEIYGDNALELRDQRNTYLDELATYMKIDVSYKSEDLGAGVQVQNMVIKLGDGNRTTLVDGSHHAQLALESLKSNPALTDDPTAPPYMKPDGTPTADPAEAERLGSDNYSLLASELRDAKGRLLEGSKPFQLKNDLHGRIQASRDMLTAAGEFSLSGSNTTSDTRGLPYYKSALDSLANKFANVMNDANRPYQVDSKGNYLDGDGNALKNNGKEINKNNPLTSDDWDIIKNADNRVGGVLFSNSNNGDSTTGITAKNISISNSWTTGNTKITASSVKPDSNGSGNQSTANDNLAHIIATFSQDVSYGPRDVVPDAASNTAFFKGSFQGMLSNISATLGNDSNATGAVLSNYVSRSDQINGSRDAVSGVDLNDEAANMMQYQKSYAAACRLLTTIDEALDKLINGTGVVGR